MNPLRIAAIVPVYNRASAVLEALDSIACQTRHPARLLIVDDGSTDDTADVVGRWLKRTALTYPATLVRQANAGAAQARNHGASLAADCDLLAFLDSDDVWPANYLERMAAALGPRPDAVAASCDRLDVNFQTGRKSHRSLRHLEGPVASLLLARGAPGMPNTVIRADAFHRLGGFASFACYEDYHLMLRLSLAGSWRHAAGDPVVVRRNIHLRDSVCEAPLSKKHSDRGLIAARAMEQFLLKEGGADAIRAATWRPRLAQLWCRAGMELRCLGRPDEAAACFRRAVELRPLHLRARWNALWLRWAA